MCWFNFIKQKDKGAYYMKQKEKKKEKKKKKNVV